MSFGKSRSHQLSLITDQLYLCGVTAVKNIQLLEEASITHILNVARELSELTYPEHLDVYFESLRDAEDEDLTPVLEKLVDYVHEVVLSSGRIVVHCIAGVSRSASVCIAYLVKYHDMSLKEAHDHVHKAREVISPNNGFWKCLIDFEYRLRGENSVEMLPFIAGLTPNVDNAVKEMMFRIRIGWMDYVFFNMFIMVTMLIVQMVSVIFFRS